MIMRNNKFRLKILLLNKEKEEILYNKQFSLYLNVKLFTDQEKIFSIKLKTDPENRVRLHIEYIYNEPVSLREYFSFIKTRKSSKNEEKIAILIISV